MTGMLGLDPLARLIEKNGQQEKKVIVIAGPTATGKTDLSLKLAKKIGGEIVSADAMQVYQGLDIGTAKATLDQLRQVPHHLIDIKEVTELYNAADYAKDALAAIEQICSGKKVPIVVGGNGFYLQSLIYGPPQGPPSDPMVRRLIEEELELFGAEMLYAKLQRLDSDYAKTITLLDKQKIVRALEIIKITGKKVSDFPKPGQAGVLEGFEFLCYFIYYPKEILYQRIEERCEAMIREGLIEETVRMKEKGLESNSSAAAAIGYRQALEYLKTPQQPSDYELFLSEFKKASRHYAKRQFTWFRKQPLFQWVDLSQVSPERLIDHILSKF